MKVISAVVTDLQRNHGLLNGGLFFDRKAVRGEVELGDRVEATLTHDPSLPPSLQWSVTCVRRPPSRPVVPSTVIKEEERESEVKTEQVEIVTIVDTPPARNNRKEGVEKKREERAVAIGQTRHIASQGSTENRHVVGGKTTPLVITLGDSPLATSTRTDGGVKRSEERGERGKGENSQGREEKIEPERKNANPPLPTTTLHFGRVTNVGEKGEGVVDGEIAYSIKAIRGNPPAVGDRVKVEVDKEQEVIRIARIGRLPIVRDVVPPTVLPSRPLTSTTERVKEKKEAKKTSELETTKKQEGTTVPSSSLSNHAKRETEQTRKEDPIPAKRKREDKGGKTHNQIDDDARVIVDVGRLIDAPRTRQYHSRIEMCCIFPDCPVPPLKNVTSVLDHLLARHRVGDEKWTLTRAGMYAQCECGDRFSSKRGIPEHQNKCQLPFKFIIS